MSSWNPLQISGPVSWPSRGRKVIKLRSSVLFFKSYKWKLIEQNAHLSRIKTNRISSHFELFKCPSDGYQKKPQRSGDKTHMSMDFTSTIKCRSLCVRKLGYRQSNEQLWVLSLSAGDQQGVERPGDIHSICCGLNVYIPPRFICRNHNPNVMVFGNEASGR